MKKLKITKEQYEKITKLISESNEVNVPPMGQNVDKEFRTAFTGKKIKNFTEETDFDIKKPIKGVSPKVQGRFMREGENDLKQETMNFINYLYNKNEDSPSYDEICEKLLSKGIVVKVDGKYKLSKSLGSAEEAKQALENELSQFIGGKETEIAEVDGLNSEFSLKTIFLNNEVAILKDSQGSSFVYLYYYDIPEIEEYVDAPIIGGEKNKEYAGRDSYGNVEYDDDIDYEYGEKEITEEDIDVYLKHNTDKITFGEGIEGWDNGDTIVKIDDELKEELIKIYDKDKQFVNSLSNLNEINYDDVKQKLGEPFKQEPKKSGLSPEEMKAKLAAARAKSQAMDAERFTQRDVENEKNVQNEMTSTGSVGGSYVGPFGAGPLKRKMNETTQGEGSIGQYDANALPIGRNGEFKKVGKTKAETTPQWAGGEFVEFNDCTKLNNKPAGSGCSTGAIDNVVKTKKAKGSVNAPSLAENKIYETIAKQTGRTIDEVKRIIETKKNK